MLIAAAAVYGGVSYTALKREQLNELEALCHMLRLMQDELETRALPLPELAAQLDTRTENAGKALLSGLLRRLPEYSTSRSLPPWCNRQCSGIQLYHHCLRTWMPHRPPDAYR